MKIILPKWAHTSSQVDRYFTPRGTTDYFPLMIMFVFFSSARLIVNLYESSGNPVDGLPRVTEFEKCILYKETRSFEEVGKLFCRKGAALAHKSTAILLPDE